MAATAAWAWTRQALVRPRGGRCSEAGSAAGPALTMRRGWGGAEGEGLLRQGENDALVFATAFLVVHSAVFYTHAAVLWVIQQRQWLQQYKVEPGKMPPKELQRHALLQITVGNLVVNPALMYWVVFPMLKSRLDMGPVLPGLATAAAQVAVFMVCEDTTFYWSHRLLHHRLIYKYIHKQHHEFKYNVGIAAEYSNPIESLVTFFCLASGLLFIQPHVLVFYLWFAVRVIEAIDSHSGYRFPWSPFQLFDRVQGGAQRHEFHHSHNVGSFGSWFCFWDWLMGTDVAYRAYQITQTRAVHRRSFDVRTQKFALDLADQAQHTMAVKLHEHVTSDMGLLDTWTDVALNGTAVANWKTFQLPRTGTLSFVVKQTGFAGYGGVAEVAERTWLEHHPETVRS